jgi:hypothetical protein
MRIGSSRNLGDLVVSMPSKSESGAEEKNPGPRTEASVGPVGAKRVDAGRKWYRRVKETKRSETGNEKS